MGLAGLEPDKLGRRPDGCHARTDAGHRPVNAVLRYDDGAGGPDNIKTSSSSTMTSTSSTPLNQIRAPCRCVHRSWDPLASPYLLTTPLANRATLERTPPYVNELTVALARVPSHETRNPTGDPRSW